MYGTSGVQVTHRTYEISKTEMEAFFHIINRDRKIKAIEIETEDGPKVIGGPDYQIITHNCKTYAMRVLKEMGIIDAENLSNFTVQRPDSSYNLLQTLSREELSCPLIDKLVDIDKIISVLTDLNLKMTSLQKSLKDKEINNEVTKQLIVHIQNVLRICNLLLKHRGNAGGLVSLYKHYIELSTLLDSINALKAFDEKESLKHDLAVIVEMVSKVIQVSKQKQLYYYWKTTPPVITRLNLDNFDDQEKRIYLTKIKANETSDGLDQILIELDKKISISQTSDQSLYLDLIDLKSIIQNAKKSVDESREEFLNFISQNKPENIAGYCAKQQKALASTINIMEQALSEFAPRSKETSGFIRFINRIVAYFKQDFIKIENVHSLVEDKVASIKQSITKGHNTFFKPSDDIEPKQEELVPPNFSNHS